MQEEILEIHIENEQPLELMEFVNSLSALSSEFSNYCKEENIYLHKDTKLYIEEIKKGSIIARLKAIFDKGLDIYKTSKSISNFYNNRLKPSINCLLNGKQEDTELNKQTIKNTFNLVGTNIRDNNGHLSFSLFNINIQNNRETKVDEIRLSNAEQNIIQNRAKIELENMEKEQIPTIYNEVVFYWEQTKKGENNSVDKGIIVHDLLPKKPIKVIIDNKIKEKMISGDVYGNNYIINAIVLTGRDDKIVAYKITDLLEIIEKEN